MALSQHCPTTRGLLKIDYEGTRWSQAKLNQITVAVFLEGHCRWNLRTHLGENVQLWEDGLANDSCEELRKLFIGAIGMRIFYPTKTNPPAYQKNFLSDK